jgi:hypothetical protein
MGMHEADAPNPVITDMPLAAKTKIFKDDDENFLGLSSLWTFPWHVVGAGPVLASW